MPLEIRQSSPPEVVFAVLFPTCESHWDQNIEDEVSDMSVGDCVYGLRRKAALVGERMRKLQS